MVVKLRTGFSTGACAAAASKAAATAVLTKSTVDFVDINLPSGLTASFKINKCGFKEKEGFASVIKDAGDDPDVTNGAEIVARIEMLKSGGIVIEGGEGVGTVCKPGLGLEVGRPAINPVPVQMITWSVKEVIGNEKSARVTISVPDGEKISRRTLNARLGIIGGISILGTTGLVIPYSNDAYRATIKMSLDVAISAGCSEIAFSTGGRSQKYGERLLNLPGEAHIQMADYVGYALEECSSRTISKIYICAFIGKLSKIAGGFYFTHASQGELDADFLPSLAIKSGLSREYLSGLKYSFTSRHFLELISDKDKPEILRLLCQIASRTCEKYTAGNICVESILFDFNGQLLARAGSNG
ncbi:MAG: cobalt-precorrin-5B (C(1))-methyltransferase [Dehalococcoidia bacterium]|nr:cobalt-precorrin-5B (C(1))-methyltransferase [Dehalococcoidia bacterium]